MTEKQIKQIQTLGQLKKSDWESLTIKEEIRKNLVENLKSKKNSFEGIIGFEDTVVPDIERALLSKHNILLLGLRGQAKTRIARLMTELLDDYIPYVTGSEINDDPYKPLSRFAIDLIEKEGDKTPISWLHKSDRFVEKLATPDVSVADLIGDVDPIKAANLKLPYSDQRVIHFGLVPRSHRSIFVINELPDLQPRIQVSLFNILQEGDLQIRGFKLRLPLDIQFVFTANPEDYTNRGSIVTPLKDRIESQILTHYPKDIATARAITEQEALVEDKNAVIHIPDPAFDLLESISFKARASEYVDENSGVSARLSISALENLISTAERRTIINGDKKSCVRLTDFWGIIPSMTGKVELVYEGEQEGPHFVALHLIGAAMKDLFLTMFPHPENKDKSSKDPYGTINAFFSGGNSIDLENDFSDKNYLKELNKVAGLSKFIDDSGVANNEIEKGFFMELVLHGLSEFELINKSIVDTQVHYEDPLANMFGDFGGEN